MPTGLLPPPSPASSVASWTDDGSDVDEPEDDGATTAFRYQTLTAGPKSEAKALMRDGYVVLRLFDEREVPKHQRAFDAALRSLREYRSDVPPNAWQYAKTGFGALATPSSYHNEAVRYLRLAAHERVLDTLRHYDQLQPHGFCGNEDAPWNAARLVLRKRAQNGRLKPRRVHAMIDRMAVRVAGQQPGAESWHRDVSYTGVDDAVTVFGGWIALTPQFASLVPGTHGGLPGPVGFAALSAADRADAERRKVAVPVPAGCLLLMHQNIVHEVVSRKHVGDEPMRRLFTGWRLTYSRRPLCEHSIPRGGGHHTKMGTRRDGPAFSQSLEDTLRRQGGVKLPSDQFPDLYNEKGVDMPDQHRGLRTWLDTYVRPELFETVRTADGSRVKFQGGAPPRHMLPVESKQDGRKVPPTDVHRIAHLTGQRPYEEYTDVEVVILRPMSFERTQLWREECAQRRRALEAAASHAARSR
jgi:hypothetical protein